MTAAIEKYRSARVLLVTTASAGAFVLLALLFYWLYFSNRGAVFDPLTHEGLRSLQLLFYATLIVHSLCSVGAAAALFLWLRPPKNPTLVAIAITFALLEAVVLFTMSGLHVCNTGTSFPIPGLSSANCD